MLWFIIYCSQNLISNFHKYQRNSEYINVFTKATGTSSSKRASQVDSKHLKQLFPLLLAQVFSDHRADQNIKSFCLGTSFIILFLII